MAPLLLLLLPALLAAAAAADCKSLDLRVESASRDTATVSLAPPPKTKKIRFEYYTGRFPTIDEVWVKDSGNAKREHYVMTDLDPGTEYSPPRHPRMLRVRPVQGAVFSPSLLSPRHCLSPPSPHPPIPLSPLSPSISPLSPLSRSPLSLPSHHRHLSSQLRQFYS